MLTFETRNSLQKAQKPCTLQKWDDGRAFLYGIVNSYQPWRTTELNDASR